MQQDTLAHEYISQLGIRYLFVAIMVGERTDESPPPNAASIHVLRFNVSAFGMHLRRL